MAVELPPIKTQDTRVSEKIPTRRPTKVLTPAKSSNKNLTAQKKPNLQLKREISVTEMARLKTMGNTYPEIAKIANITKGVVMELLKSHAPGCQTITAYQEQKLQCNEAAEAVAWGKYMMVAERNTTTIAEGEWPKLAHIETEKKLHDIYVNAQKQSQLMGGKSTQNVHILEEHYLLNATKAPTVIVDLAKHLEEE